MKSTVKNWKLLGAMIDVVFAIVAVDLVWLTMSWLHQDEKKWSQLTAAILPWILAYVGFRCIALNGKKKALITEATATPTEKTT